MSILLAYASTTKGKVMSDQLNLKIWREPALGVYYYEIANADGVVYIEGTDPNPYGVIDTLANEMCELGWRDADELLKYINEKLSWENNTEAGAAYSALRAVLEHLKGWRDWESRWKGHMSMTILADEERNARYKLVKELTAIIEKELQ